MYTRILLPLDGSEMAEQAIPFAVTQAERFKARLILLQAVEPILYARSLVAVNDARDQRMRWSRDYLEGVAAGIQEQGIQTEIVVAEEVFLRCASRLPF